MEKGHNLEQIQSEITDIYQAGMNEIQTLEIKKKQIVQEYIKQLEEQKIKKIKQSLNI